jgi:SAM-dependent methyltransferase
MDARTGWNHGAKAYIHFIDSGADYYRLHVHGPGLIDACGDVRGATAVDLGCGHGYFARELARRGAQVVGIDLSDELVAHARIVEEREPLDILYHCDNAARIENYVVPGSIDLVTACMSLQDMDSPESVLQASYRILKPAGKMVFSIPHPCTDPPHRVWRRDLFGRKLELALDRYFEATDGICEWSMPRLLYSWRTPYRRFTLTQWSDMIASSGFVIRRFAEPRPTEQQVRDIPDLDDSARMPYFLVFVLEKA